MACVSCWLCPSLRVSPDVARNDVTLMQNVVGVMPRVQHLLICSWPVHLLVSVNNLGDLGEMNTWAPLPAVAVPPLLGVWLVQSVHGLTPKLKLLFFTVMLLLKMVGIDLSFEGLPLQQPNKIVAILRLANLEQHLAQAVLCHRCWQLWNSALNFLLSYALWIVWPSFDALLIPSAVHLMWCNVHKRQPQEQELST